MNAKLRRAAVPAQPSAMCLDETAAGSYSLHGDTPGRGRVMRDDDLGLLQGTLDLLVLKVLAWGPHHGYGIARWIKGTSGDALVACAGVTLNAVSTSLGIAVRGGTISAEGDLDFRGTLGVSKDAPVGFRDVRLLIDIDTDASPAEKDKLLELTQRYCVVLQTLRQSPTLEARYV